MTTTESASPPSTEPADPIGETAVATDRRSGARRSLSQLPMWAGSLVALLLFTQVVVPNPAGHGARGTPTALLFLGLVEGLRLSMTAVSLVLIYRVIRVINFAAAALGVASTLFLINMVVYQHGFPFLLTFLIGLIVAGLCGVTIDLVFGRRFATASRLVLTVVTIVGSTALVSNATFLVVRAPFFPPLGERDATDLIGSRVLRLLPFPGFSFHVGHTPIPFGFGHVATIEVSIVALALVGMFMRFSRTGTALRASGENSDRAAMLGINVGILTTLVWAIAGVLSGASGMLSVVTGSASIGALNDPTILLTPLAAAVVARFRSLPRAVAASIAIGLLSVSISWGYGRNAALYGSLVLLAIVVGGLILQRKELFRLESGDTSSWQAVQEPRPIPRELLVVRALVVARWVLVALAVMVVVAFPFFAPVRFEVLAGDIFLTAIAALSLVVLTGWTGQVSLGQYAFVGVGALVAGILAKHGVSFFLCVPAAVIVTGVVAGVVGLPALRIRGLYLAGATFAFAAAVAAFLQNPTLGRKMMPNSLHRPTLVFLNFDDERSMYFLCLFALVVAIVVVLNLRRSRFGRLLIGLRESEANIEAFGVSAVRMKLTAFVFAGALAGFAGGMVEFHARGASPDGFGVDKSFFLFIDTILGGVSSVVGAVLGGLYSGLFTYFFSASNPIVAILLPLLPLIFLYAEPGGILALLNRGRDAVLRIVAQRRQLVVPSLFADYDPDAMERRLVPLAPVTNVGGLAVLPPTERFTLESALYTARDGREPTAVGEGR